MKTISNQDKEILENLFVLEIGLDSQLRRETCLSFFDLPEHRLY